MNTSRSSNQLTTRKENNHRIKESIIKIGTNDNIIINKLEKKRVLQLAQLIKSKKGMIENKDIRYNKYTKLNLYLENLIEKDYGNYFKIKFENIDNHATTENDKHDTIKLLRKPLNKRNINDYLTNKISTEALFTEKNYLSNNNLITISSNNTTKKSNIVDRVLSKTERKPSKSILFLTKQYQEPLKTTKRVFVNTNSNFNINIHNIGRTNKTKDKPIKYVIRNFPERFNYLDSKNKKIDSSSLNLKKFHKKSTVNSYKVQNIIKNNERKEFGSDNLLAQHEKEYNLIINELNKDYEVFLKVASKEKCESKYPNILNSLKLSSDVYNKFFHLSKDKLIDLQKAKMAFLKDLNKKRTNIINIRKNLELIQNKNDQF